MLLLPLEPLNHKDENNFLRILFKMSKKPYCPSEKDCQEGGEEIKEEGTICLPVKLMIKVFRVTRLNAMNRRRIFIRESWTCSCNTRILRPNSSCKLDKPILSYTMDIQ